tara:strand:+ start:245 stop:466 length:222 start_codon:yes stop_codon:yes gene_type:complete
MTPSTKSALKSLFSDEAVNEAIAALKLDLTRKAVSSGSDEDTRKQNLNMLWGLEALVVKVRANIEQSKGDQAE